MRLPRQTFRCSAIIVGVFSLLFSVHSALRASTHQAGFDAAQVSWKTHFDATRVRMTTHERNRSIFFSGTAAERFRFQSADQQASAVLELKLPPAQVLKNEPILSLQIRANRPGAQLAFRIVFPHAKSPTDGEQLTRVYYGQRYAEQLAWQKVTCGISERELARHLVLWRAQVKPQELDTREMYIDRVYVIVPLTEKTTEIILDELEFGPIVNPRGIDNQMDSALDEAPPEIEFRLDRLFVGNVPIFPRVLPWKGEQLRDLAHLGANVVSLPEAEIVPQLVARSPDVNLWFSAPPPGHHVAKLETTGYQNREGLIPLGTGYNRVLFWQLGNRVENINYHGLRDLTRMVRQSDRVVRRPIFADVSSSEHLFSRSLDMLGVSRHVVFSSHSFQDYFNYLQARSRLAEPGTFHTTWVQTASPRSLAEYYENLELTPPVMEPEQLRLQVYTALACGFRGLGYWTESPINASGALSRERDLTIQQLNLELALLEPFLATGSVVDVIPVGFAVDANNKSQNGPQPATASKLFARYPLIAAIIRSPEGTLILPIWLDRNAQYTPTAMVGSNLEMVVQGIPESAHAWEIDTTFIQPISLERVGGGTRISLEHLDQTAAILISTNSKSAETIRSKIRRIRAQSAKINCEIAQLKLERTQQVHDQLEAMNVRPPDVEYLLRNANTYLRRANQALAEENDRYAKQNAFAAMQLTRHVQGKYWNQAAQRITHPTSTHATLAFSTLPEFWKLIEEVGRSLPENSASLIQSGNFESTEVLLAEGWTRDVLSSGKWQMISELYPESKQGEYSLRLAVSPADDKQPSNPYDHPVMRLRSPPIKGQAGQILHVTGSVKVVHGFPSHEDGLRIYDNLLGPSTSIRWHKSQTWQPFQLIRPIPEDREVTLTIEVGGAGEVLIDDLHVTLLDATPEITEQIASPTEPAKNSNSAFEFWSRIPGLPRASNTPKQPAPAQNQVK